VQEFTFVKDEMTGYGTEHNEACTTSIPNTAHHLYLINEALERVMGINPKGSGEGATTEMNIGL